MRSMVGISNRCIISILLLVMTSAVSIPMTTSSVTVVTACSVNPVMPSTGSGTATTVTTCHLNLVIPCTGSTNTSVSSSSGTELIKFC